MASTTKNQVKSQAFRLWLVLSLFSTIIFAAMYVSVWLFVRQGSTQALAFKAAEGSAIASSGRSPSEITGSQIQQIESRDASFLIIVDADKRVLASNVRLEGVTPLPPQNVFNQAQNSGSYETYWSPKAGTRTNIYLKTYKSGEQSGYIIAGQNLYFTDKRIRTLAVVVLAGWLASLSVSSLVLLNFSLRRS